MCSMCLVYNCILRVREICMHACRHTWAMAHRWRPEDDSEGSLLSVHCKLQTLSSSYQACVASAFTARLSWGPSMPFVLVSSLVLSSVCFTCFVLWVRFSLCSPVWIRFSQCETGGELAIYPGLALNSRCSCLTSTMTIDACHHAQLIVSPLVPRLSPKPLYSYRREDWQLREPIDSAADPPFWAGTPLSSLPPYGREQQS